VRVGPRLAAQWRSVWISWLAKRDATGNPA
jgi:hypothetical protein